MGSVERDLYNVPVFNIHTAFDGDHPMSSYRTDQWREWLPRLAQAGLAGDRQRLELLLMTMIRSLRRDSPDLSEKLGSLLAQYAANPNGLRWVESGPPPTDTEEGLALVQVLPTDDAPMPILPSDPMDQVNQFLQERKQCVHLFSEGFAPPSSILLIGAPGTGKSMLATWLAHSLGLPLLVQDLASSISSFLGKTGLNLRRTLDYARSRPCVMLLDEFDAIAKRRDDISEVGELKRIVNVLLKELETWPSHSVLVAATNHPDLLDQAIRRRFNVVLTLPMPGEDERARILERAAGRLAPEVPDLLLRACARSLGEISGSDLETLMHSAVRRHLTTAVPMTKCLLLQTQSYWNGRTAKKGMGELIRALRDASNETYTVRELATLFDRSASTIQHHLSNRGADA